MESSIAVFLLRQLACELLPTIAGRVIEDVDLHWIGEADRRRALLLVCPPGGDTPFIRRGCKPLLLRALGGGARGNLTCPANCVDGLS